MNAIVSYQPPAAVRTILGQRPPRMPVGGIVRAGIQVLSKAAAAVPKVQQIYDAGVAAQEPFETIEKRIFEQVPELKKKPLYPKNSPWFVVRRGDFRQPELADMITDKYGTVREDGVKRLWSLPIVFPVDQWEMLLPHTYQSFTASGLKYWSEFGADGTMRCMSFAPVAINPNTKRAFKMSGGRHHVPRPDNGGLCDPDRCPEFQRKECQLRGKLYFFIPGIPTIDLIQLSTGSINGLEEVRSQMMMVAAARRGRLSGFLDDDAATFILTKQQMEVPGIDEETGQPIRRQQYIITLSARMDVTQLYRARNQRLLTQAGGEAAAVLNGAPVYPVPDIAPIAGDDRDAYHTTHADDEIVPPAQSDEPPLASAAAILAATTTASKADIPARPADTRASPTAFEPIYQVLDAMNIERALFDAYAKKKWGSWQSNPKGVDKVLADVSAGANDPDAYRRKLDSEVNVFA
jgi:hypothetical protein